MSQDKDYVGYIRSKEGFFYKNEKGKSIDIPLSKKRLNQLDKKLLLDSDILPSDILVVSSSPENIDFTKLEISSNTAYVRFEEQLFYIDKTNNTCKEIEISPEQLEEVDRKIKLPRLAPGSRGRGRALSLDELRYLFVITNEYYPPKSDWEEIEAITHHSPSEQHPLTKDFDRRILFVKESLSESWREVVDGLKKSFKELLNSSKYSKNKKKLGELKVKYEDQVQQLNSSREQIQQLEKEISKTQEQMQQFEWGKRLKWFFQGIFNQIPTIEDEINDSVSDMASEDSQQSEEIEEAQEKVEQFLGDLNTKKTAFNIIVAAISDTAKKIIRQIRNINKYKDKANLIEEKEQAGEAVPDINGLNAKDSLSFRTIKIILTGLSALLGLTVSIFQVVNILGPALELGLVSNLFSGIFTGILALTYLTTGIEAYLKWRKASRQEGIALDASEAENIKENMQDWQAKFAKNFWLFGVSFVATVLTLIFIVNPLAFFIIGAAALTVGSAGTHILSKFYLTVQEEKDKKERKEEKQCDVLVMTKSPEKENLNALEIKNQAYIRFENKLFYVDKKENTCREISISEENLRRFDRKLSLTVFNYISIPKHTWEWGGRFVSTNGAVVVSRSEQSKMPKSLVVMTVSPSDVDLKTLPFSETACVLFKDQCFYVDKPNNICLELKVSSERRNKFYAEIGFAKLIPYENFQRPISSNELKKINFIQAQTEEEKKRQCNLFLIKQWPKEGLLALPITSRDAYVRYKDQLFHVDKKKKQWVKLSSIMPTKLRDFDKDMGISNLMVGKPKMLSKKELNQIAAITGHTRPLAQRYDESLTNLKQTFHQLIQDLLEKVKDIEFFKSKAFKPFKWIFQGIKKQFSDETSNQIDQHLKISGATKKVEEIQEKIEKKFFKEFFDQVQNLAELALEPLKQLVYNLPKSILKIIDKMGLISKNKKEIGHLDVKLSLFFSFLKSTLILGSFILGGVAFYFAFMTALDSTLKLTQAIQFVAILSAAIVIPIALTSAIKAGLKWARASSSETELSPEMKDKILDWKSKIAKNAWLALITATSVVFTLLLASNPVTLCMVGLIILFVQRVGDHLISKEFLTSAETKEKEQKRIAKQEEKEREVEDTYGMLRLTYKPKIENDVTLPVPLQEPPPGISVVTNPPTNAPVPSKNDIVYPNSFV